MTYNDIKHQTKKKYFITFINYKPHALHLSQPKYLASNSYKSISQ